MLRSCRKGNELRCVNALLTVLSLKADGLTGLQGLVPLLLDAGIMNKNVLTAVIRGYKAETNLRAKSLKTYRERFEPELSVRTSMADYKKEDWLLNLPLYAIEQINKTKDY